MGHGQWHPKGPGPPGQCPVAVSRMGTELIGILTGLLCNSLKNKILFKESSAYWNSKTRSPAVWKPDCQIPFVPFGAAVTLPLEVCCHPGLFSSAVTEELLYDPLQLLRLNFLQSVFLACHYTALDWEFYLRIHSPSENPSLDAQLPPGIVSANTAAKASVVTWGVAGPRAQVLPWKGGVQPDRGHLILTGPIQPPPRAGGLILRRTSSHDGDPSPDETRAEL